MKTTRRIVVIVIEDAAHCSDKCPLKEGAHCLQSDLEWDTERGLYVRDSRCVRTERDLQTLSEHL